MRIHAIKTDISLPLPNFDIFQQLTQKFSCVHNERTRLHAMVQNWLTPPPRPLLTHNHAHFSAPRYCTFSMRVICFVNDQFSETGYFSRQILGIAWQSNANGYGCPNSPPPPTHTLLQSSIPTDKCQPTCHIHWFLSVLHGCWMQAWSFYSCCCRSAFTGGDQSRRWRLLSSPVPVQVRKAWPVVPCL